MRLRRQPRILKKLLVSLDAARATATDRVRSDTWHAAIIGVLYTMAVIDRAAYTAANTDKPYQEWWNNRYTVR
jgi:hypothetical protein